MDYKVKNGVVYCENGIPFQPRWIADNRLNVAVTDTGITQVEYRIPELLVGASTIFLRTLFDGFRYFIEQNKLTYKPSYENSAIYPFGIDSKWNFKGDFIKHGIYTVDECILIKIKTPESFPQDTQFKLEFYDSFALIKACKNDWRFYSDIKREWKKWEYYDNILKGGFSEYPSEIISESDKDANNPNILFDEELKETKLDISIYADFDFFYKLVGHKHVLKSGNLKPNTEYTFTIGFTDKRKEISVENAYKRYKDVSDRSPKLISPYEKLNDFIAMAPLYLEALKLEDCKGAIRGKTTSYGVWGWDGITCNLPSLYCNDNEFIKNMLDLYDRTSHKALGIAHCFTNDMRLASASAPSAQGMYITLLFDYYSATNDIVTLKKHFPLAKKIFLRNLEAEATETGFSKGQSLFPDFPKLLKETSEDLSVFNNCVFYSSSREIAYLAAILGDTELSEKAIAVSERMEKNFFKLFYNKDKNFVVNSVNGKTLEHNDCYCATAVYWESSYLSELVSELTDNCMSFFDEHIVSDMGLRSIPVWDDAFDADSNQFHFWWPVTGAYYMYLINYHNRRDLIDKWTKWVTHFTSQLMCPEGISYYIETDKPETDRWTTQDGSWHGYNVRGFFQAALHGVFGVSADVGGLTFYPYDGEEMKLLNFSFFNKRFDISMVGSGKYIEKIIANGKEIKGTNKLPMDVLENDNEIFVYRIKEKIYPVTVLSANGVEISDYTFENNIIKAKAKGYSKCRIRTEILNEIKFIEFIGTGEWTDITITEDEK